MEKKSLPQPRPVLLPLSRQRGSRKSISSALLIISTRGNQPVCRRHKMRKNFCLSKELFFARKLRQGFLKNLQFYTDLFFKKDLFIIYLFIYFWLHQVLVAAHVLLSSCGRVGFLSSCGMRTPEHMGSVVCSTQAL